MIFQEERKWWKKGYKKIACLDEAGRGPLAGPVVAAAVVINSKVKLKGVKDSKQLSAKKREEVYKLLTSHSSIKWGTGKVSEKVIDRINILEASKLAMRRALKNLKQKPHFLILDGNFKINSDIPQKSIIKADEKVFSCMLASIIAKVTRDKIMERYHKKYPQYDFNKHKGYPTRLHIQLLKKYGPCKIHRKTFSPVASMLKYKNKKY